MWIIENPGNFICGIYDKEERARRARESLGRGYRLRKLKVRKFPFHIMETFEKGKRQFSFWQGTPDFVVGENCIDYHISKPWEAEPSGADKMGTLLHTHNSYFQEE